MAFPKLGEWLEKQKRPAKPKADPRAWLTARETAALLGISEKTLRNWRAGARAAGDRGPDCRKVAGIVRYDPDDVERYLAALGAQRADAAKRDGAA